jgi:hypothetical protein
MIIWLPRVAGNKGSSGPKCRSVIRVLTLSATISSGSGPTGKKRDVNVFRRFVLTSRGGAQQFAIGTGFDEAGSIIPVGAITSGGLQEVTRCCFGTQRHRLLPHRPGKPTHAGVLRQQACSLERFGSHVAGKVNVAKTRQANNQPNRVWMLPSAPRPSRPALPSAMESGNT